MTDVPFADVVPEETDESEPPFFRILDTVNVAASSASVSSLRTSSCDPVLVTVASSLTLSVSFTATGSSFIPVIVIVIFAVAVPLLPSETS